MNKKVAFMKAMNKIFCHIDLIYLTITSLACQFLPLPDIVRMLVSIPFFLIVPTKIGGFILSLLKNYESSLSNDPTLGVIVNWCMGSISIFCFALLLAGFGLFNIYALTFAIVCILVIEKIYSRNYEKPQFGPMLKKINANLGDYRTVILSLLAGLMPIFLIYRYWPFPLKLASDAFGDNMLTLRIIQQNVIDLFASGIHPPMKPVLFSVPSLVYNVFPFDFEWGLPFVIFPIFSLIIYIFSYKISGSKFLSLFASIISMGAFGNGIAVNLSAVHQRDFVMILFPIALFFALKTSYASEKESNFGHSSIFKIAAFSFLAYSTIQVSLVPFEYKLPAIFLGLLYVLFIFLFFSVKLKSRFGNVTRPLCGVILSLFIVYFGRYFYFLRPDFLSWSYLWTLFGIVSASLLIITIIFPSIKIKLEVDNGFVIASFVMMLFHEQLGIFMVSILLLVTTIYHLAKKKKIFMISILVFIASIFSIIVLEKIGFVPVFSNLPQVEGAFSFNSNISLLEMVFTSTIIVLFISGAAFSLIYRKTKEVFLLFTCCSFLLFYLLPISDNYRAIIFIVPIVAYFSAYVFQTWNRLLFGRIVNRRTIIFLDKFKFSVKTRKTQIFFLIILLIFLPTIFQPYTNYINDLTQSRTPHYTFDRYEYDLAQWINKHTPEDVIIISEPFTARTISRLSDRGLIIDYVMTYNEKGNTHSIGSDPEIVNKTKSILRTENVTFAISEMLKIRKTYLYFEPLNKKLGSQVPIDHMPLIFVINGRTTEWINSSGLSEVIYPKEYTFVSSYDKFFNTTYFNLLYDEEQIFVFELRADLNL